MHLILVGYSSDATRRSLALCERTFAGLSIDRRILVWNGAATASPPAPQGWDLVGGSNRLAEFSGWQEGIEHVGGTGDGAVLLANDTLGSHRHPSFARRWALRAELRRSAGGHLVGFSDLASPPPGELRIGGLRLDGWLSTYCFSTPPALLRKLGGRLFDFAEVERCVPGGTDPDAFFSDLVSADLQRHLRWWLFGGGWYRSAPLAADNAAAFALKARCICAELLLSAKARAFGIELRDPMRGNAAAARLESVNDAVHGALSAWKRRRPAPLGAGR